MQRSHLQRRLIARATAWLLIFVCAWMGTDGVLHHTDAEMPSPAASTVHHLTAAVPADTCAACEWTQGMQTGTLTLCRIPLPLVALHSCLLPTVRCLSPRISRRCSPRAPPLSFVTA